MRLTHSLSTIALNSRDTQDARSSREERLSKKINVPNLMIILNHPENDYGHPPVKIFDHSKQNEPLCARLFGNLRVHCPFLHSRVNSKSKSLVNHAKAFELLTNKELTDGRFNVNVPCLVVSKLLTLVQMIYLHIEFPIRSMLPICNIRILRKFCCYIAYRLPSFTNVFPYGAFQ